MTLLPSFNGNGIRENAEIRACPDSRLTGVKRLAALDPNFFLRRCVPGHIEERIKSACLFTVSTSVVQ